MRITVVLVCATLMAACAQETQEDSAAPAAAPVAAPQMARHFAPETGVVLDAMTRADSGEVYIQDLQEGSGAPATPGSRLVVEYKAWLPDGLLFEQRPSPDGFGAAEFVLDQQNAPVPGLVHGITGMRTGGTRRIVVPPALGYGLVGRPARVPPNATLIFEVRLRSVRPAG